MKKDLNKYEYLEQDYDGSWFPVVKDDVEYICFSSPKVLQDFEYWFEGEEEVLQTSLYHKGTRLFFTYQGVKYRISWVFFAQRLIDNAIEELKKIGASDIMVNYGELD